MHEVQASSSDLVICKKITVEFIYDRLHAPGESNTISQAIMLLSRDLNNGPIHVNVLQHNIISVSFKNYIIINHVPQARDLHSAVQVPDLIESGLLFL